jgi:hypothetical protein
MPFAAGGPTVLDNLQLRCRAHNLHEAEKYFGPRARCPPEEGTKRHGVDVDDGSVRERALEMMGCVGES